MRKVIDTDRKLNRTGIFLGNILVLILGSLITISIFMYLRANSQRALTASFENDAYVRTNLIAHEFHHVTSHLSSLKSLVNQEGVFSRRLFREALAAVYEEGLVIRGFLWVPRVKDNERAVFEQAVRREGFPLFAIRELDFRGSLSPVNRRSEYFPVYYHESQDTMPVVLGYDLGSDSEILAALELSRDTGRTYATERTLLSFYERPVSGILIMNPVYRSEDKRIQGERRANLRGYLVAVIVPDTIMRRAIEQTQPMNLPTTLMDITAPREKRVISYWKPRIPSEDLSWFLRLIYPEAPVSRTSFTMGGREYQVVITAGSVYVKNHYRLSSWLVIPFGLLLTLVLALYIQGVLSSRASAEDLVRKRTRELAMSEQKYRGLFEQSKDGLVICDMDGMVRDANMACLDMIGYSFAEIEGRPYHSFIPQKWHALSIDAMRSQIFKQGFSDFYQSECIRKDGSVFPVNSRSWVIRAPEHGKIIGVTIWFQDITEWNRTRESLKENEEQLKEAQSLAQIGSGVFDMRTHHMTWTPELFRIFDMDSETTSPSYENYHDIVHPQDRERVNEAFILSVVSDEPKEIEYRLLLSSGKTKYIHQFYRTFFDNSGAPMRVAATIQDITQRKVLELEAVLNQARIESLIRITQKYFSSITDLLDYALEEAIKLTGSRIGYIYYYDDTKQEFILNTWSKEVMKECRVRDRDTLTRYDLAKTGIWGEAVRQARPIIINDFHSSNPLKKGYPEGHVALDRFMTIPVFSSERIVAVVGVANKDADYEEGDVNQLVLLMTSVWQMAERRKAEEALKESEERYHSLFENSHAVMLLIDPDTGAIVDANGAACAYYGYARQEILSLNIRDISTLSPEELAVAMENAGALKQNNYILRHRLKDGQVRDVEVFSGPITVWSKVLLYSIVHDITNRMSAEKALKEGEERQRLQFKSIPVPTYIWKRQDNDFILSDYNDAALDFTRGKIASYQGVPASMFYEGKQGYLNDMLRCFTDRTTIKSEFWDILKTTGEKKYLSIKYAFLPPDSVMLHMDDMTLEKEAKEHLVFMSIHDPMTGLYNRFYADSEITRLKGSRKFPLSIIVVDIDGLKTVNDTNGHAEGDMLIKNAAYILRQTFRPEDMVARIGGDEFLILLPSVDTNTLDHSLKRLKVYMENFNASDPAVPVSLSAGAATALNGEEIDACIKLADMQMYRDKYLKKSLSVR